MWLIVTVVAVVVLVATYLTWIAARVDRLHARAAAAYSALDAQSVRRAAATAALTSPGPQPNHGTPADTRPQGNSGRREGVDPVSQAKVAARAVLAAHPDDREAAENDLTHSLRTAAADGGVDAMPGVEDASRRLALARQVHSDLVRDALAVRQQPLVRLLRLARRHPLPRFFDIDDPTLEDTQDLRHRGAL
jgi:hypothetical protein